MTPGARSGRELGLAVMPAVFVLIWSTGFIVARYAMPHAPPLKFLALRYGLSVLCFGGWVWLARLPLPTDRRQWLHLGMTGVLMHAVYLGGVWSAVRLGLGAGTTALIVGLQPLLTAVWTNARAGDVSGPGRVTGRQWVGLVLGFVGLLVVVRDKLGAGEGSWATLALAVLALLGITTGTLYQKRFVRACDVRVASLFQLGAAALLTAPLAAFELDAITWHPHLLAALGWSVLALTLGASSMLYLLIQRGVATQVTSLLYLVPPCTALLAWMLFGEALTPTVIVGIAITVGSVALVTRSGTAPSSRPVK